MLRLQPTLTDAHAADLLPYGTAWTIGLGFGGILVAVTPATIPQALDLLCDGLFLLFVLQRPGRQTLPRSAQLQIIFQLTPTATRLADALLDNDTIQSHAPKAGVSRNATTLPACSPTPGPSGKLNCCTPG